MRKMINFKSVILFIFIAITFLFYFNFEKFTFQNKQIQKESNIQISTDTDEGVVKIIAIGDSLTAGYGLNLNESYPMLLEKKLLSLDYKVKVINAGISGETSAGLRERIDFIKSQKPDMVLITIGGNDAIRNLPVDNTRENISEIIKGLSQQVDKKKIYLMNIKAPDNLGPKYTEKFNVLFKDIANEYGINLIPFVEPEVFLDNSLMQNDGIHPNKEGYSLIIDKYIFPRLKL